MQVTETRSEGLIREFKIAVPAADIQQKTDGRLQELARTAKLPGFRPGKVPVALLRKRFGVAVRGEALEQMVKDATGTVLSERGLRATGQPKIEVTSTEPDGDFEYTLAVELLPDVTPPDYAAITLERLVVEPEEATIDSTVQDLAARERSPQPLSEPRPTRTGDVLIIDFVGRIEGEEFPGGKAEGYELELGSGSFIPGFEDQLVGMEMGETRHVTVSFPTDYGAENLAGKAADFEVTIHDIKEMGAAVVDDALAKRFGKETVAELRNEVVEAQRRELRAMSRMVLKRSLLDRLAEMYDFELPASMVDAEYRSIVNQVVDERRTAAETDAESTGSDHDHDHHQDHEHHHDDHDHDHAHDHDADETLLSDAEQAEYRGLAERRVRLGLVLAEVGRANNLQITPDELKRALYLQASRVPGREREMLALYEQFPQAAEAVAGSLLEDKVVDFILEMATVSERTVNIDELRAALQDSAEDATSTDGLDEQKSA